MYARSPSRPLSVGPHWPSRRRVAWPRRPFSPTRGMRLTTARPDLTAADDVRAAA